MEQSLKQTQMFSSLSDLEIDIVSRNMVYKTFAPGTKICSFGEPGGDFYIILNGLVKVSKKVSPKKELVLAKLQKGDSFGEMSLFDQRPRTADITAIEETETAIITQAALLACIKHIPAIAVKMLGLLSQKLQHANEYIEFLAFSTLKQRLISFIVSYYKKNEASSKKTCKLPFSTQELADFFGVTVESILKALDEITQKGSIKVSRGKITVKNLDGLAS